MKKQIGIAAMLVASVFGMTCLGASGDDSAKIIKVSAKRFEYSPQEITLKKGAPVVFQLTTEDRSHGFSVPSMNLRADIVPGKVTELKVTPQKAGEFDFFCDVFCGSGHEGMNGKIKVTE
jgi:cytochrome c oxidase subunit II